MAIDGKPSGPFSNREIGKEINKINLLDVKFRTENLVSSTLVWKDGMAEWKPIFKIPELKKMLQGEFWLFS